MDTTVPPTSGAPLGAPRPRGRGLVVVLLLVGLLGHVLAAYHLGYGIAYLHHVAGFVLIAVVTGLPLLVLWRLFWRGRADGLLLVFAGIQALLGVVIYYLTSVTHR